MHQLGFRIAAGLNHERVYAINWMGGRFGLDRVIEFGRTHGQEALTDDVFGDVERETGEASRRLAAISIREELCRINKVANLELDHRRYLTMARIGVGDEYVGAEWVAGWYERNLKIFVNLTRITTTPRDRILVIIGGGHVPILTQLIRDSSAYLVETVDAYLC